MVFPYLSPYHHLGWQHQLYDNLSLLLINKDNVSSSCLNFPITLVCKIPQYLEVFTFQHSLRFLFIPDISSFQSTLTTKLPVDIPCYVIMPSFYILSALAYRTHSPNGPPFLPYFRTFCTRGILLCYQYEISYNLFSKLVPWRYISVPQYILSNLLLQSTTKFYPSQYLPFLSHTAYAFFSASIHSPSPLLHSLCTPIGPQPLIDSEMLTRLLSPTFLSNAPSLFLTYQLKLFSSLLTQLSQLIRPLPPFFMGTYILATSLLGCSSLFIVMIFLHFLSISGSSSLFHLIVPAPYLMSDTAQASH